MYYLLNFKPFFLLDMQNLDAVGSHFVKQVPNSSVKFVCSEWTNRSLKLLSSWCSIFTVISAGYHGQTEETKQKNEKCSFLNSSLAGGHNSSPPLPASISTSCKRHQTSDKLNQLEV